jgi:hypothetical protein
VLQACSLIDAQLPLFVNRSTQSTVILASVFVVGIVLGVIDVLLKVRSAEFYGE